MIKLSNNQHAFLELVKAGLWKKDVCLSSYRNIDFSEVLHLAQDQSVVGLVAAGLEHIVDINVPKEETLQFVGVAIQLEQRNVAMNQFIEELIEGLRNKGIYSLLVKGQGIAQCYERPLWRACGDIDLYLSESNLKKAKEVLIPLSSSVEDEDDYEQHLGMIINTWLVELHGNLRTRIAKRIDKGIELLHKEVFYGGNVRSWKNGNTQVFMPAVNIDVILIFTHILKHYYREGIGLRQICDWCRLMWVYRETINLKYLDEIIHQMGIVSEWKAFAALAVEFLDMPSEAMPFYVSKDSQTRKAYKILYAVFETGDMGHNRDLTYQKEYSPTMRKLVTFGNMVRESARRFFVFPSNSVRSLLMFTKLGIIDLFRNK